MREVHAQIIKRVRAVRPEAFRDRRPGVEAFPEIRVVLFHFVLRHRRMLPDEIPAGVVLPVEVEDFTFFFRLLVNFRAGKRRHDARIDHGQAVFHREIIDLIEARGCVLVEAENEGADDIDARTVHLFDVLFVIFDLIERLVGRVQRVLVDGFDADKEADAAGARGEFEKLFIAADQFHGPLATPFDVQGDQGFAKFVGVFFREEDIVVDEEEDFRRITFDFFHDVLDGTGAEGFAVHQGDRTKIAAQRATAAGLDDLGVQRRAHVLEQILAGHRQVLQIDQLIRMINRLELVGLEVGHDFSPDHFDFIDDDGVEVPATFFDHEGGMTAAADDPDAFLPESIRDLIAARGLAAHHGDAHQICRFVRIEPLEFFLYDFNFVEIRFGQRRDDREIQMVNVLALHALDFESRRSDE